MENQINQEIGRRIRDFRVSLALSREEIARRLGVSRPSVANIENGNQNITVSQVFEFAARLGVDPQQLIPFPKNEKPTISLSELLPNDADATVREWVDKL